MDIRCKICGTMRPECFIGVNKIDMGASSGEPGVAFRYIRYCKDNSKCYEEAINYKESKEN
jgi:hypothetical protein